MAIKIQGVPVLQYDANNSSNTNIAVGNKALANTSSGNNTTALGYQALASANNSSRNLAIGAFAGANLTTGSNNVIIGSYNAFNSPINQTGSNWVILSDGSGNVRLAIDSNGNTGIGNTSPADKLSIGGTLAAGNTTITGTLNSNVVSVANSIANVTVVPDTVSINADTGNISIGNSSINVTSNSSATIAAFGYMNQQSMNFDYTVPGSLNAVLAGPYVIGDPYTLTIAQGGRLVIV